MSEIRSITTATAVAKRVITARAAYDQASRDLNNDFIAVTAELKDAVREFREYRCSNLAELAAYANALWTCIAAEEQEREMYGEHAIPPLEEFFPIANSVRREFERLLSCPHNN